MNQYRYARYVGQLGMSPAAGIVMLILMTSAVYAQQAGGIRGTVYDSDFDVPLPLAQVLIVETNQQTTTSDQGNYVFDQVDPGTYTLVFSKDGYTRQVKANVVVSAGRLTDLDASLAGEFTEMEEFVVQDLDIGGSSEIGLINLRLETPAFLSSIGSEQMSLAGASDAAAAVNLVAGATVSEGKYAVIRGLPDRYVSSKMNGVRLPTADADKRAVQLDQFPAAVVENIQVSKTFTPDQQGDASGGAVDIVTKGIPDETTLTFKAEWSTNSQAAGSDFLTYNGGGVDYWGRDDGSRDIQYDKLGDNWEGAVGVSRGQAPTDYKWSLAGGRKHTLDNNVTIGGFANFFYERDSSYYDDGIDDKLWVDHIGEPMTPHLVQIHGQGDFKTQLFDVTQGSEEVKWGTLATLGAETENHALNLVYMYTRTAEDTATLAEDTRGKTYYFPDYNPYDPKDPGNQAQDAAPYLRAQTLQYTERTTQTLQLSGRHTLLMPEGVGNDYVRFLDPEIDWTVAFSSADMAQPDKRQFGSLWWGPLFQRGFPPYTVDHTNPPIYHAFKPEAAFTVGNLQRIWKEISEDSKQFLINVKLPFQQWSDEKGYVKLGAFHDTVDRAYNQESFGNFNEDPNYQANWEDYWSDVFPTENHPITAGDIDVDYDGEQTLSAWYGMMDLPLNSAWHVIGGTRFEKTELSIVNHPEQSAKWIPVSTGVVTDLGPGDADVAFSQTDWLPSIGFEYKPWETVTLRGTYSQTVARQTFKELSPIQQVEFLGGDVFVGNPDLTMSALKNYDLRADYTPYSGGLVSLSYFHKDLKDPIEYVQRVSNSIYTTAVNYPDGTLSGFEFEVRQDIGHYREAAEGLILGANATFIDSEVTLPPKEVDIFEGLDAPTTSRDMTGAPEYLYNLYVTYDWPDFGTQIGLFYTVKGDTLVAGAGQAGGKYVPNVYAKEYSTLNLSVTHSLKDNLKISFKAKNLTNPQIQEIYRSDFVSDTVKTSYKKGIDISLGLEYKFY